MKRARLSLAGLGLSAIAATPAPVAGQSLPPYAPINPVLQMRTGLATIPYLGPGWQVSFSSDYGNLIEYGAGQDVGYLLDAEVLAARIMVSRSLGPAAFLLAETSLNGSYDGFLDGFLEWYHKITGLNVAARDLRPRDEFGYEIRIGERQFAYQKSSGFIGDVRLGGGVRYGPGLQSAAWLTLPTGSTPAGYRKGVVSANVTTMLHRDFGPERRFTYEGTVGLGFTPRHGELREWQRNTFFLVAQGVRARFGGPFHGYANLIYGSPSYRNTGIPELDRAEITGDFGALFRFGRGPSWVIGMTQDLAPKGPAIDVAFRLGVYW